MLAGGGWRAMGVRIFFWPRGIANIDISKKRIAEEVDGKNAKEIREYAQVFWQKYTEIADYQKYIGTIEAGEE